jgi:dihydrofolate reductase
MKKQICIIAALQEKDRGIGYNNDLVFKISDDLKRFKRLTLDQTIIMGRKTFESIGSRPLPRRTNIVVSRNPNFSPEGVIVCSSIEEALAMAETAPGEKIFIIGGAQIYQQALSFAHKLELTFAQSDLPADIFFLEFPEFPREIERQDLYDEKTSLHYSFVTLVR